MARAIMEQQLVQVTAGRDLLAARVEATILMFGTHLHLRDRKRNLQLLRPHRGQEMSN